MAKAIILSAPSGSGKTTLVRHLVASIPQLAFSTSATTRKPREGEEHGKDYYFLTIPQFKAHLQKKEFVEYEEVYKGIYYGTLKQEIRKVWSQGKNIVFDVDVKGGLEIKKFFKDKALGIFIQAPNINVIKNRLISRGTETPESLEKRLAKIEEELTFASEFDRILVNSDLEEAKEEIVRVVTSFIRS